MKDHIHKHVGALLLAMYIGGLPTALYLRFDKGSLGSFSTVLKILRGALGFVGIQLFYGLVFYAIGLLLFRVVAKWLIHKNVGVAWPFTLVGASIGMSFLIVLGVLSRQVDAFSGFPQIGLWDNVGFPWVDLLAYGLVGGIYSYLYAT